LPGNKRNGNTGNTERRKKIMSNEKKSKLREWALRAHQEDFDGEII